MGFIYQSKHHEHLTQIKDFGFKYMSALWLPSSANKNLKENSREIIKYFVEFFHHLLYVSQLYN